MTRLRKITETADDSSGSIGDECQRAAALYARACRLGEPDPVKLAAWLVKFRADSPGWPHLELADFVDSFDERALATYRRAVTALDRKLADRDRFGRFEIDAMLLELADHDGDVDRAVGLLTQREHTQYGAIVDRLRAAGRTEDAVTWIDRAVAAGRVSSHGGGNSYCLSPDGVAATGPGWAWRELADQGAKARPGDAADLYRPQLESDLRYPDTKLYPRIAATLATMKKLYERGGRTDDFASFIAQFVRTTVGGRR